jgi:uncharacterized OB-fold protein
MTVQPYDKPLPDVDDDSRPFWEGACRHELMLQRCNECHRAIHYPRSVCPHCGSLSIKWFQASGLGTIYSYTVARFPAGPSFVDAVPLVVALIDLDEGVRMMTNLLNDASDVRIGSRVEVVFDDVAPDFTFPKFKLS